MEEHALSFDPRYEELSRLQSLSRRGFLGRLMGGVAGGAALLSAAPGVQGAAVTPSLPASQMHEANDEPYWRWVADQFLLRNGLTYMNTGTRGPSPASVYKAQIEAARAANIDRVSYSRYIYNSEFTTALREKMAAFIGCKSTEVAFTNNTTEGMAFGTLGLDFKAGDEIIYTNHDHSSGAQPVNLRAARQGVKAVVVDLSDPRFHPPENRDRLVDAFEAAITSRTRLISFCHVNYTDGCLLPVKEICEMARAKGIMTLVDGAHPPGMLKLDLHDLGCDMYAGACHKWMMAAMLTGFFYVREEIMDRVWPTVYSGPVNNLSMYGEEVSESSRERSATARKFEMRGSSSYAARVSIDAALDFHNQLTQDGVEARDRYLAARAYDGLQRIDGVRLHTSEDPSLCCALVSFSVKDVKPSQLSKLLWDRHQIYIRSVTHSEIGWDANRASLHLMVTAQQVDNLLGAVEEIARKPPTELG
jgi:isopenicillin-N epimerase